MSYIKNEDFYRESRGDGRGTPLEQRWDGLVEAAAFRSDEEVLDVGCAEGLIPVRLGPLVRRVVGWEVSPHRVDTAQGHIARAGVANVEVVQRDISLEDPGTMSFDTVMMLDVYGIDLPQGRYVGPPELTKLLRAAREQVVLRVNVQDVPGRERQYLEQIHEACAGEGFDVAVFLRVDDLKGNLVLCQRRGTRPRGRVLPPYVIQPLHAATGPVTAGAGVRPDAWQRAAGG